MFSCSVAQYLLIRKSVLEKIPSQFTNLSMFLISTIMFVGMAIATQANLAVSWYQLAVLIVLAIFDFSFARGRLAKLVFVEHTDLVVCLPDTVLKRTPRTASITSTIVVLKSEKYF